MSSSLSLSWSDSSTACCPRWAVISCRFSPDHTTQQAAGSTRRASKGGHIGHLRRAVLSRPPPALSHEGSIRDPAASHTRTLPKTSHTFTHFTSRPSAPYLLQGAQLDSVTQTLDPPAGYFHMWIAGCLVEPNIGIHAKKKPGSPYALSPRPRSAHLLQCLLPTWVVAPRPVPLPP